MIIYMQLDFQNWTKLPYTQIFYADKRPLSSTTEADIFLAQKRDGKPSQPIMALKIYKKKQKPSQIIYDLIGHRLQNVIQFYEVKKSNACFCLMQLCGSSLREYKFSNETSQRCSQILAVARQAINGLIQLKQLRIIHADIKPQNLLMSLQETLKICDLDFAVTEKRAAEKRMRVGTFEYMAPEMLLQGKCSYKSDIWSLGILIYELYFGKHPFPNLLKVNAQQEQSFQTGYKIISSEIEQIRQKLYRIRENSENQPIIQLMSMMLYCLSFKCQQRKGLQQCAALLSKSSKLRKMSYHIYNNLGQKSEQLTLNSNMTLINIFHNLLKDLKSLPKQDILHKKAKELQINLQHLLNLMKGQNHANKHEHPNKHDIEALLQKFSVQSRKVISIVENNLKRVGSAQKMVNYHQKINLIEHLQLANSFLSKQSTKQKAILRQGFYSAEELSQTQ